MKRVGGEEGKEKERKGTSWISKKLVDSGMVISKSKSSMVHNKRKERQEKKKTKIQEIKPLNPPQPPPLISLPPISISASRIPSLPVASLSLPTKKNLKPLKMTQK